MASRPSSHHPLGVRLRFLFFCVVLLWCAVSILWSIAWAAASNSVRQQIDQRSSTVRVLLEGGQLRIAGRLTTFSGQLDRTSSLADSSVNVSFDLSSVDSDPVGGFQYLDPDVLFRSIASPRVSFRSTRITRDGSNRYRVEGIATRGGREYRVQAPLVVMRSDAVQTECRLSLAGALADLELGGPFPASFAKGSVDAHLVFKATAPVGLKQPSPRPQAMPPAARPAPRAP